MRENVYQYQIQQKRIYSLAYGYMANHEDAEDIVQEVLIRLWNHSSRIASENMIAWISQVTRNVCLDALRRRKSYRSVVSAEDPEPILQNAQAIEKNVPQYLKKVLNQLEEQTPPRLFGVNRSMPSISFVLCNLPHFLIFLLSL